MDKINIGGQRLTAAQMQSYMKKLDTDNNGTITQDEVSKGQKNAKANGYTGLEQFAATLNGKGVDSFESLCKIAGKDPKNGLILPDADSIIKSVNKNNTAISKDLNNADQWNAAIKAANKGKDNASRTDLEQLRDKLAKEPANKRLDSGDIYASGNSPASRLKDAGFKTYGEAKKYLDTVLDKKNQGVFDMLDTGAHGGKKDKGISTNDVGAVFNSQNTAARNLANNTDKPVKADIKSLASMTPEQQQYFFHQLDTDQNGSVTEQDIKTAQKENQDPTLDPMYKALLGKGPDSYANLLKIAGKKPEEGLTAADLDTVAKKTKQYKDALPAELNDADKLKAAIKAATGKDNASQEELSKLKTQLETSDGADTPFKDNLSFDENDDKSKAAILYKGGFSSPKDAAQFIGQLIDPKNEKAFKTLDTGAHGGKADNVISVNDVGSVVNTSSQAASDLANMGTDSTDKTTQGDTSTPKSVDPAKPLTETDNGVSRTVSAADGIITTHLYKKGDDGSIKETVITSAQGKKTGETTTTRGKDGSVTGTQTIYNGDGKPTTTEIKNGADKKYADPTIPKDAAEVIPPPPNDAPMLYTVQAKNGADDYLWNVAERALKKAGMKTDGASIQAAVDAIADKSGLQNADVVADNKVLDLSTIYSLQAKGTK